MHNGSVGLNRKRRGPNVDKIITQNTVKLRQTGIINCILCYSNNKSSVKKYCSRDCRWI